MVISWDLTSKNCDFMGFNHQQCRFYDFFLKGKTNSENCGKTINKCGKHKPRIWGSYNLRHSRFLGIFIEAIYKFIMGSDGNPYGLMTSHHIESKSWPFIWGHVASSGWWYTYPSWKYEFVSWDDEIPNRKNKKCSKPPNQSYKQRMGLSITGTYICVYIYTHGCILSYFHLATMWNFGCDWKLRFIQSMEIS